MADPASPSYPWHERSPQGGSEADMAALRRALEGCGFTAGAVCGRLGIQEISEYKSLRLGRTTGQTTETPLDALIHLLMDGEYVERQTLEALLPPEALPLMEALGLVAFEPARPELCYATVMLVPARGLLLASDRSSAPGHELYSMPADVVYPAAMANTHEFLATLPETPCDSLLDLGAGTGIAALDAARYARHAWATDIAARSVRFAEFNRRLNGVENVTVLEGDMYQPLEGLTFDRIVAHLPYVPARANRLIFRDGGADGEEVLRRAVEGLPRMLRPGGEFRTLVTAADCDEEVFEDRLRRWLGVAAPEFDLVLVAHRLTAPKDLLANMLANGSTTLEDWRYDREVWARRKVMFLFHGSVVIRRHRAPRPAFTSRALKGEGFRQANAEWLLDWETAVHDPAAAEALLETRPALAPHCELAVIHHAQNGRLAPKAWTLRSKRPFDAECICQEWLVQVVAACDGKATWREQLDRAKRAGWLDPATTPAEYVELLGLAVSNGFLQTPERPAPES